MAYATPSLRFYHLPRSNVPRGNTHILTGPKEFMTMFAKTVAERTKPGREFQSSSAASRPQKLTIFAIKNAKTLKNKVRVSVKQQPIKRSHRAHEAELGCPRVKVAQG